MLSSVTAIPVERVFRGIEAPLARMGASVARAAGFPDLVAATAEAYVAKAVDLASDPQQLEALATRAQAACEGSPLFDLDGWVRSYEEGLQAAWELAVAGNLGDVEVGDG